MKIVWKIEFVSLLLWVYVINVVEDSSGFSGGFCCGFGVLDVIEMM